jgi:hypothetical protein
MKMIQYTKREPVQNTQPALIELFTAENVTLIEIQRDSYRHHLT